jgi:formate dehydrogenase assembly factor FdhD
MKSISVTMRTPGNDFELAVGFLMTEGVIRDAADIAEIVYVSGRTGNTSVSQEQSESAILPYQPERNIVRLELQPEVPVSLANLERNFYTTSSCGICGKASLLALRTVCPHRIANDFQMDLAGILKPVYAVGAEALESEIAAEDFGDALRWQAGRGTPVLVHQKFQLSLEDREAPMRKNRCGSHS